MLDRGIDVYAYYTIFKIIDISKCLRKAVGLSNESKR